MGLKALKEQGHKPKFGRRCIIAVVFDSLDQEDADFLTDALLPDSQFTHTDIALALQDDGHDVGRQQVGRHRRGECTCTKMEAYK